MLVDFDNDPTENMENAVNGNLMSNFDHEVNKDVEKELIENGNLKAYYPGWEFYGTCWYQNNSFYCRVIRYRNIVVYYKANTPEELMEEISSIYGYN
jgi:hypothetical protein